MDRRSFINASGRWLMLAALLALSGSLVLRHRVGSAASCPGDRSCTGCRSARSCTLPKRQKFLLHEKGQTS